MTDTEDAKPDEGLTGPQLMVLGRAEADMLVPQGVMPIRGVIAIAGKGESPCRGFEQVEHRLKLEFDDTARQVYGPIEGIRRWMQRQRGEDPDAGGPKRTHADQIVAFAEQTRDLDGVVLCHCRAGVSRSTAAALICLATWLGRGREEEAASILLAVRPSAAPHAELVQFGDDALGRGGKLVGALYRAMNPVPMDPDPTA